MRTKDIYSEMAELAVSLYDIVLQKRGKEGR